MVRPEQEYIPLRLIYLTTRKQVKKKPGKTKIPTPSTSLQTKNARLDFDPSNANTGSTGPAEA